MGKTGKNNIFLCKHCHQKKTCASTRAISHFLKNTVGWGVCKAASSKELREYFEEKEKVKNANKVYKLGSSASVATEKRKSGDKVQQSLFSKSSMFQTAELELHKSYVTMIASTNQAFAIADNIPFLDFIATARKYPNIPLPSGKQLAGDILTKAAQNAITERKDALRCVIPLGGWFYGR